MLNVSSVTRSNYLGIDAKLELAGSLHFVHIYIYNDRDLRLKRELARSHFEFDAVLNPRSVECF